MIRIINQVPLLAVLAVTLVGFAILTDTLTSARLNSSTVVIESVTSRSALHYHNTKLMWKTKPIIAYHTSDR